MMKLSLLFTLGLALFGCKSIEPIAPIAHSEEAPNAAQPISTISLPIEIDLSNYYKLADKQVPMSFEGGEHPCEGVSFDYYFLRDPLKLNANNNQVTVDVTGKYRIKMSYCVDCSDLLTEKPVCVGPRIPFSCGIGEPMRRMSLQFSSKVALTPKYGLQTTTSLTEVKALDPCEVTVFSYDATDQLLSEVKKSLGALAKDIDKQTSGISFRKEAGSAWKQASETVVIPGFGNLHLNPIGVSMVQPTIQNNKVFSTLIVTAQPIFDHSATNLPLKPLPDLVVLPRVEKDSFQVFLDMQLNYDSLSSVLQHYIEGTKLQIQGKEVVIDSLKINGADKQELLFKVSFSGKKSGKLYLRGTPNFDPVTQQIFVERVDFDLETKSVLLKTAKWLFSDRILQEIQNASKQDLKPQLLQLRKKANESLVYSYQDYQLKGKIDNLEVSHLFPEKERLLIRVRATGKLKLTN